MKEDREPIEVVQTPAQRRSWLLAEALRSLPLDQALELARTAEAFIMGAEKEPFSDPMPEIADAQPKPASVPEPLVEKQVRETRPSLALLPEQREQLLDRLAQGARNREVASEFGLSPRQVQGVRMGSAREIADRRNRQGSAVARPSGLSHAPTLVEDVVRYLRQQDDVVVRDGDGIFCC